jgi:hypothetical protein
VGDFNRDGKSDVAITGPAGWGSVPIAFSSGDGNWSVTNESVGSFASWASTGAWVLLGRTQ